MSDDVFSASSALARHLLAEGFNPRGKEFSKGEALLWSVSHGKPELVRLLIDAGVDLNWRTQDELTAAHIATRFGRSDMLPLLHAAGADLTRPDKLGYQPLHWAVRKGDGEAVRLLISSFDVHVDCRLAPSESLHEETPLHMAALCNDCDTIKMLVHEFGANIKSLDNEGHTALHYACFGGSFDAVKLLIQLGSQTTSVGDDGNTPLHKATAYSHPSIVEYLIGLGADTATKNNSGETALHLASGEDAVRCAEIILRHSKTDLEERDNEGMTPLLRASKNGSLRMDQLLVDAGALIIVADTSGSHPLHYAAMRDDRKMIQLLVNEGADIEAKVGGMVTPLLTAVSNGCYDAICALEDLGANVYDPMALYYSVTLQKGHLVSYFIEKGLEIDVEILGRTPLCLAVEVGNAKITSLLLDSGANIEKEVSGWRPLHFAAAGNYLDIVGILLERGAEPAPEDIQGHTPETLARKRGHSLSLIRLLQDSKSITKTNSQAFSELVDRFVLAARAGDISQVARHVEEGLVDINAIDVNGERAITAAARLGHETVVEFLVQKGGDPNLRGTNDETALWWASFYGHEGVVRRLLDWGARPDLTDRDGQTPLSVASRAGHTTIVSLLLGKGAKPNTMAYGYTPLLFAVKYGHGRVATLLLDAGADLRCKTPDGHTIATFADDCDKPGIWRMLRFRRRKMLGAGTRVRQPSSLRSPKRKVTSFPKPKIEATVELPDSIYSTGNMVSAAREGAVPLILRLIRFGASVHGRGGEDGIPIIEAASAGKDAAVMALLRNGADLHARHGKTGFALHHAARNNHVSTVRLLCAAGSDINRPNHEKELPLTQAASAGHAEVVKTLLELGSKKETKDKSDCTPLWWAVENDRMEVVEILLDAGANVNCADDLGHTPLSITVDNNNERMARLLLKKGAQMRPISCNNMSPLCIAASNGNEGLVELLIEHGAALNHLSDDRNTPLILATLEGHSMVAKILIEMGADTELRNDSNRTALSYAKEKGEQQIVSFIVQAFSLRLNNDRAMRDMVRLDLEYKLEYPYENLDEGHIRLLYLHPGKGEDIISTELSVADLSTDPIFEALSYEWKGEAPTIPIQCGRYRVRVAPNCKKALKALRSESETRVLWIDAVCIDQKDKDEVNKQVALMDQIYHGAEQVYMWLGEETDYALKAFASFPVLYQACEDLGTHTTFEIEELTLSDVNSCETAKDLIQSVLSDKMAVEALNEMCRSPYFSRSWILQEIILGSSRGILVCGKKTCAWSTAKLALSIFGKALEESGSPLTRLDHYPIYHISKFDDLFSKHGKIPLETLLGLMFLFHASDPRDKVFAIQRLAAISRGTVNPPMADYTLSAQDVYVAATRYCIYVMKEFGWGLQLQHRSLKIVQNLPSWVPDYSISWENDEEPSPFRKDHDHDFRKLIDGQPATTTFVSLYIDGCLLDKIVFSMSLVEETDTYDIILGFVQALAKSGRGLYDPYPPKDREVDEARSGITGTIFEAFLRACFYPSSSILKEMDYPEYQKHLEFHTQDEEILEDPDWETCEEIDVVSFLAWKLSVDYRSPAQSKTPPLFMEADVRMWHLRAQYHKSFDYFPCLMLELEQRYDYDLVYTEKGHVGLAPAGEAKEGMTVALLDRTRELCLLRGNDNVEDGGVWYEYMTKVFLQHLTENVDRLEDIYSDATVERIEIR